MTCYLVAPPHTKALQYRKMKHARVYICCAIGYSSVFLSVSLSIHSLSDPNPSSQAHVCRVADVSYRLLARAHRRHLARDHGSCCSYLFSSTSPTSTTSLITNMLSSHTSVFADHNLLLSGRVRQVSAHLSRGEVSRDHARQVDSHHDNPSHAHTCRLSLYGFMSPDILRKIDADTDVAEVCLCLCVYVLCVHIYTHTHAATAPARTVPRHEAGQPNSRLGRRRYSFLLLVRVYLISFS